MEIDMDAASISDDPITPESLQELQAIDDKMIEQLVTENIELRRIAFEDPKTGLPNGRALFRALKDQLETQSVGADGDSTSPAYIFLHFDNYEDALNQVGESQENFLLRTVTARICDILAESALKSDGKIDGISPFTLKPDCFGILLDHAADRKSIATIIRALHFSFRSPIQVGEDSIKIALSGGICIPPDDGNTPEQIISRAHLAYEDATKGGSSGFRFYAPQIERVAQSKKDFENELRRAIEAKEFKAFFQPKIDLETGAVIGSEALARWINSSGQTISPAHFIPLAEELGLIDSIGEQILFQACAQTQFWRELGYDVSVAVNVSPKQFNKPDLQKKVIKTLATTRLSPTALELEITESMAISDPERVLTALGSLQSAGVKLAIDDFGTGHSNLSSLANLPFDVFKIDRQFISAIGTDEKAPAIVDMMLAMARSLGLKVVAEGVETPEQISFLKSRSCDIAQGFHYGRPMHAEAFTEYLQRQTSAHQFRGRLAG